MSYMFDEAEQLHRSMRKAVLTWALLLGFSAQISAQTFALWGDLKPGPYSVGFQSLNRYDYSRTFKTKSGYDGKLRQAERARPLQVSIWYPAKKINNGPYMMYEEYVYLAGKEEGAGALTEAEKLESKRRYMAHPVFEAVSQDKLNGLMKMKTAAIKDASPLAGRFPLIIFGQGLDYESPAAHSILCEYLASHGYVVAATPYLGSPLRESPHDLIGLEAEVRDMEYLIAYLHDFPNVDRNRLGVAGFDFGGMAALLLQMRNTDVDAVVSLDSGIMFQHNTKLLKQSPYYNPANVRVPLMQVTASQADIARNGLVEDLGLFESAKYSNTYLLRLKGMRHEDFTSYGMISNAVLRADDPAQRSRKIGYEVACRYVLNFFNAYLRKDRQSLAFLRSRPEKNGVPPDFLTVETKEAVKAPPTEQQFMSIILEEGTGRAAQVYREIRSSDPGYLLFKEENLNNLGYQFLRDKRVKEALEIFRLNVEAYPQSWNAYDSLGEAFMVDGDKELAIQNYKKSLELNPQNTNAVQMLNRLTGK